MASGPNRLTALWLPLPPRALNTSGWPVEVPGAANLSSYEVRFEHVCMAAAGCGGRRITIRWAMFEPTSSEPLAPYAPIPAAVLQPTSSALEQQRRALLRQLESGWGTFYFPSMLTWVLLPESFAVKVGLYQLSTGQALPPDGLVVNKPQLEAGAAFGLKAGPHSYNHSFAEASIVWRASGATGINVTWQATVRDGDSSQLTLLATLQSEDPAHPVNVSDYALLLFPNFTHGRAGTVAANATSVSGTGAGLRTTTVWLLEGRAVPVPQGGNVSGPCLGVVAGAHGQIALSTDASMTAAAVQAQTLAYRQREVGGYERYGEWAVVKDAIQTALMWAQTYAPKAGIVFPEYHYSPGDQISPTTVDGDTSDHTFEWDGALASFMLSLDALDLALNNVIQLVKMKTAGGFVPGWTAGTFQTNDVSDPPLLSRVLLEIVKRWGLPRTRWVVELCFDDLYNWNTWIFANRREVPLGLLSYGSSPYPFAPDGTTSSVRGGSSAPWGASGLDNGPVYEFLPWNQTHRFLQDELVVFFCKVN